MEIMLFLTKAQIDGLIRNGWLSEEGRHYRGPCTSAAFSALNAAANDARLAIQHHRLNNIPPATPTHAEIAAKEAADAPDAAA